MQITPRKRVKRVIYSWIGFWNLINHPTPKFRLEKNSCPRGNPLFWGNFQKTFHAHRDFCKKNLLHFNLLFLWELLLCIALFYIKLHFGIFYYYFNHKYRLEKQVLNKWLFLLLVLLAYCVLRNLQCWDIYFKEIFCKINIILCSREVIVMHIR